MTRGIFLVGSDSDYLYFMTRSFTQPKSNIRYDITISKRDGSLRCSCMDHSCRPWRRNGQLLDAEQPKEMCKHSRKLLQICASIFRASGLDLPRMAA